MSNKQTVLFHNKKPYITHERMGMKKITQMKTRSIFSKEAFFIRKLYLSNVRSLRALKGNNNKIKLACGFSLRFER